ncbi:MAG: hypothetical protein GY805_05000 [Chloroflexi bacterium]|nr:hypothetical protein [Chloroflexota bacterium]
MMELLKSKKFQTSIIAVVVMLLGDVGLDLDPVALMGIVSPFIAYILGQGIADAGKEREKVKRDPLDDS